MSKTKRKRILFEQLHAVVSIFVSLSLMLCPISPALAASADNTSENTVTTTTSNAENTADSANPNAQSEAANANETEDTASTEIATEISEPTPSILTSAEEEEKTVEETEKETVSEETEKADTEEVEEEEEAATPAGELYKETNEGYSVTVKYGEDAKIPEKSTLSVKPVAKDEEKPYADKLGDALDLKAGEEALFTAYLDISIISPKGEEVKPASPVDVEIRLAEKALPNEVAPSSDEIQKTLEVVHFDDSGQAAKPEEQKAIDDGGDVGVSFTTESFSVFSITSIAKQLSDWVTNYLTMKVYSLFSITANITSQNGVVPPVENETEVLEAYSISGGSLFWLDWIFNKQIDTGKYGSVDLFSTKSGSLGDKLPTSDLTGDLRFLNMNNADGFALVKDTGLRTQTFDEQPAEDQEVEVSGRAPIGATAIITDVTEAHRGSYDKLLAAYDVTISDGLGGEFQPESGSPMEVSVANPTIANLVNGGGQADVKHVLADGSLEDVDSTWDADAERLVFDADGFSVYIIIDHEGNTTVTTPRVQFHYLDEEYTEGAGGVYTAGPFNFYNKANPRTYQWTQILTDGEELEMIVNPPNLIVDNGDGTTSEKFFYGWYVVDLESENNVTYTDGRWTGSVDYTWTNDPEKVVPEVPLSITTSGSSVSVGDTISWSINGASGTGVLDEEGIAHIYLAPIYENYYFVNFRMGSLDNNQSALQNELLTRKLAVLGADNSATVRIGDIICQGSDPTHQVFIGWQTEAMSHEQAVEDQYYATVDDEGNETENPSGAGGYYITLNESDFTNMTYELYPLFAEARWLYFSTGQSGNGSTYIGATYRLNNDEGVGTYYDNDFFNANTSVRNGYNMAGWYAFAKMDNNSKITNLTTPQDVAVSYVDSQGNVKSVTFNMTAQELVHHNSYYHIISPADNSNIATTTIDGVTYTLKTSGGIYYLSFGGNDYKLFGVTDNKLYFYRAMDDLTLYANWTMDSETTIRVIIWKQKVTDNKNTSKTPVDLLNWLAEDPSRSAANYPYTVKDYDYEIFYVKANALTSAVPSMTSFSGYYLDANGTQHNVNNLNLTTLANNTPSYLTSFTGFHYSCNDASIVGTPSPDGSSVYNVYYDRDLLTMTFNTYGRNGYALTTSNTGTQYAYINDEWVELSYQNGEWVIPEYGDVYTASTAEDEIMYGDVGGQKVLLTRNDVLGYTYAYKQYDVATDDNGTQYALVDGEYVELTRNSSTTTTYTFRRGTTYTASTASSRTMYGIVNGAFVQLTRSGNIISGYTYSYNGSTYNGTRYTQSTNNNTASYTGTLYTLDGTSPNETRTQIVAYSGTGHVYGMSGTDTYYDLSPNSQQTTVYTYTYIDSNNQTVTLSSSDSRYKQSNTSVAYTDSRYTREGTAPWDLAYTETSEDAVSGQWGVDNRGGHVGLTGTSGQVVGYSYSYNGMPYTGTRYTKSYGPTGNYVVYPGPRYVTSSGSNSWRVYKAFTGLFGQTLAQNGYAWPTEYDWYDGYSGSGTSGTRTTFLDTFTTENSTNYYGTTASTGSNTYNHYKQNVDGTWPEINDWTNSTPKSSSGTWNFTEKYDGFEVKYYYAGTTANAQTNWNNANAWTQTSAGSSASAGNNNFYIRYARKSYDFTFDVNYPDDATITYSDGKSTNITETVAYEGSLSSYGTTSTPTGTNWYYGVPNGEDGITATHVLKAPDHYSFGGWYEDATCTVPFNFNSTMPAANKIVYAKWEPDWFVIHIDPNGAEIDHINHDAAGSFSRAEIPGERAADSGYNPSQSTYFWLSYGKTISEYSVNRNYAPISDEAAAQYEGQIYYYMNHQYSPELDGEFGLNADARNALYLTEQEVHQYYSYYASYAARAGVTVLSEDVWRQYYVSSQKYRICSENETYKFLGWYEVLDAGTENEHLASMPYVFSTPISGDVTLRAMWRLDGGYKIQYHADYYMDDGTYINGTMADWFDPKSGESNLSYADGAYTTIYKQPYDIMVNGEHTDEYDFRGFRLVSVQEEANGHIVYTPLENNVYYQPGDDYTVLAANADRHGTIHLQAVYEEIDSSYRRPYVTNLTLDANGGYLTDGSGTELDSNINLTAISGWNGIGTVAATAFDPETGISLNPDALIEFGDIQSNQAIHLYRYATELTTVGGLGQAPLDPAGTNYFAHPQNYFLLGFDEVQGENDYIADYAADGVISISRNDNQILYAVWEPMIYLNFENNTSNTVTFDLAPTQTGSLVLYVLNQVTGLYDRQEIDPNNLSLEPGESIHLALPYGEEQELTVAGTNNLGVGKRLIWNTSITDDDTGITYTSKDGDNDETTLYDQTTYTHTHDGSSCTHDLASGSVDSSGSAEFEFNEKLLFNSHGITVTFDEDDIGYALVLDDNYTGGGTQEYDYPELSENDPLSQELPSTSTRMGYQLLGWAYSPNATTPDYSATLPVGSPWEIADLYDFFRNNPSVEKEYINDGATLKATLYAVWDINNAASTVYVYKNVPEPGNQHTEFSFEYRMQGTYRASGYSNQTFDKRQVFTLAHGEYAVLISSNDIRNVAKIQTLITIYNADGTIKKDASDQDLTYTVSWNGTYHNNGGFQDLNLSVTETELPYYDASVERSAQSTNNFRIYLGNDTTGNVTQADTNTIHWTGTDAGGTVVFTNQRQTHDIVLNKVLHSNTTVAGTFAFSASYTIDGETVELPDSQVTSGTPNTTWLENIPAGAVLTITEANNGDYDTVITAQNATDGQTVDNYSFVFTANDDDTITFDNTLKSYPVKFRLYDQYGNPLSGMFSMSSATSSLGNQLYADPANDGIFYQNNHFWAGEYTLNENIIPSGYIGLTDPATISVSGDGITTDSDMIYISEDPNVSGGYIVTVYNIVPSVEINLTKKLDDPLLDQRTFTFTVGYTYDLLDPEGHVMLTINKSSTYPIQATHQGTTETILVPGGATVTAAEVLTAELIQTYDVTHNVDNTGEVSGASWSATIPTDVLEHTVVFTNTRKTVQVTVQKEAPTFPQDETYHFDAILDKRATGDNKALANWEIAPGYTTNLAGYMVSTSGGATGFTLNPGGQMVLTIPYGSCLRVLEDEGNYKTSVTLDSGDPEIASSIALSATQTRQNHTITFTNTLLANIAPTDASQTSAPYQAALVLGAMLLACVAPVFKKGGSKRKGGKPWSS